MIAWCVSSSTSAFAEIEPSLQPTQSSTVTLVEEPKEEAPPSQSIEDPKTATEDAPSSQSIEDPKTATEDAPSSQSIEDLKTATEEVSQNAEESQSKSELPDEEEPVFAAEEPQEIETLVITGSRIKSVALESPSPVLSLSSEDALFSGQTDVIDVMTRLPSLSNSINSAQTADQQGIEGDTAGGSSVGVATLNLRSLGTKRTLVLVDGRRHVGGRAGDTAVDINTIPVGFIDRIEVLTGGASAVYGADAVSGVVNIITKTDFDGVNVNAQVNANDDGKGARYYVSGTVGSVFADGKGSAMVGIEYRRQSKFTCGEAAFCRDFGVLHDGVNPAATDGDGIPGNILRPEYTFAISSAMGRIGIDFDGDGNPDSAAPAGFFLDTNGDGVNDVGQTRLGQSGFGDWVVSDGELRLFRAGDASGFANQFGGDGIGAGPFNDQSIVPEQDSLVANAIIRYKLWEGGNFFSDTKTVYRKTATVGAVTAFNDLLTVSLENPYIPGALRSAIDNAIVDDPSLADTTSLYVTKDFLDLGPVGTEVETMTLRTVNGIEGDIGEALHYEASYNYGRTTEETLRKNIRIEDRFFAAIDVVRDANNRPVCRSEIDPAAAPPPTSPYPSIEPGFKTFIPGSGVCKPLNIFGNGAGDAAAIDFVTDDAVQTSMIDQHVLHLSLSGDTSAFDFDGWAGPLGFAVGGEYRREYSRFRPHSYEAAGLSFDGSTTTGFEGSYDVWEAFGEVSVPVFAIDNLGSLTVTAAGRVSDYSTAGLNGSWNVGANWMLGSALRLRGGYAVAVRAPNVGELFQAETTAFFRPRDPCDKNVIDGLEDPTVRRANCEADGIGSDYTDPNTGRFAGVRSGNKDLEVETAKTYTVGVVAAPRSLVPGLRLSFDYFNIELENAINAISALDIVNNCYDDPTGIDNQFCQQFTRNRDDTSPTYLGLNFLQVQQLNLAKRVVAGIDFEVAYALNFSRLNIPDLGVATFRVYGTHLFYLDTIPNQEDLSFVNPELNEIRRPAWQVNSGLRWQIDRLQINYDVMFMSNQAYDDVEIEGAGTFVNPYAGDTFIQNISAAYALADQVSVYGGVNNFTNSLPIGTSTSYPVSPLGRTWFLGLQSTL